MADFLNIFPSVDLTQQSDGLLGLLQSLDLVVNDQRNFGDLLDLKTTKTKGPDRERNEEETRPERKKELVIQGSHMVSGTRCPAGSDSVNKWSESRAAAPKGK